MAAPICQYYWATLDKSEAYQIASQIITGYSIAEQTIEVPDE